MMNDHTPGYPSAARFVAQSFIGLNLDNRALPGVHIGVVMGRNAGFLTAASSIAQKYPDDGPHLIYLPEREFSMDKFLTDVRGVYDKYGRCMVAISEGIKDKDGNSIIANHVEGDVDAHGNRQLSGTGFLGDLLSEQIKAKLGIQRVRSDTLGYLQRSFFGCVSSVDQHEAREVGEKAAQFAIWHNIDGSITINRTGNYSVEYRMTDLKNVAANTRLMPDEYINKEGNNVTDAFKYYYLQPLLGDDMPQASMLRAARARKILQHD
jgi:6-phosphofructokinase 1